MLDVARAKAAERIPSRADDDSVSGVDSASEQSAATAPGIHIRTSVKHNMASATPGVSAAPGVSARASSTTGILPPWMTSEPDVKGELDPEIAAAAAAAGAAAAEAAAAGAANTASFAEPYQGDTAEPGAIPYSSADAITSATSTEAVTTLPPWMMGFSSLTAKPGMPGVIEAPTMPKMPTVPGTPLAGPGMTAVQGLSHFGSRSMPMMHGFPVMPFTTSSAIPGMSGIPGVPQVPAAMLPAKINHSTMSSGLPPMAAPSSATGYPGAIPHLPRSPVASDPLYPSAPATSQPGGTIRPSVAPHTRAIDPRTGMPMHPRAKWTTGVPGAGLGDGQRKVLATDPDTGNVISIRPMVSKQTEEQREKLRLKKKMYPCPFCGHAFSCSSNLSRHKRVHTGEKPYNCGFCGAMFSNSSNRRNHEQKCEAKSGQNALVSGVRSDPPTSVPNTQQRAGNSSNTPLLSEAQGDDPTQNSAPRSQSRVTATADSSAGVAVGPISTENPYNVVTETERRPPTSGLSAVPEKEAHKFGLAQSAYSGPDPAEIVSPVSDSQTFGEDYLRVFMENTTVRVRDSGTQTDPVDQVLVETHDTQKDIPVTPIKPQADEDKSMSNECVSAAPVDLAIKTTNKVSEKMELPQEEKLVSVT